MKINRAIAAVTCLTGIGGSSSVFAQECLACDKTVEMTREQAVCFLERVPDYLSEAERADPVIILLDACSPDAADGAELSDTRFINPMLFSSIDDANGPKSGTSGADANAEAPGSTEYVILSGRQILCLEADIKTRLEQGSQFFSRFSDCS